VDAETRAYLDDFRRELTSELGRITARFDDLDQRLEEEFSGVDAQLSGIGRRGGGLDQRLDILEDRIEAVRREVGVLIQHARQDVRLVTEMVVANTEAIGALRVRLDAR